MESAQRDGETPGTGTVHWLTGLAGAGKSTLGRLLVERLRSEGRAVVFLDGDELRERVFPDAGYSREERLALARRYSGLCAILSAQGLDVVCATISLFPEVWSENRRRLARYREILVRAPLAIRRERKPALYERAPRDGPGPLVGEELAAPEPPQPHVVLENDGVQSPREMLERLWRELRASHGALREPRR